MFVLYNDEKSRIETELLYASPQRGLCIVRQTIRIV
jgi:hypothetical protein